ncbi:MAG: carboxypeptidase regulatory-like domain-containing protein, partial [Archangium sp.]|nr:carboxypeptidase regulatory-like domain-containing protein [Archangium sp.]
ENSTQTDEKGAYTFAAVGPGPVKVRVEAQGFNQADEVAQVPAEGEATLDVTLEALGKGSPATVRGLIRSRTGEAVKANVVVKGVNKKVPVNAEGRFVVTIPGGDYFFVISAPGYVSQTKKVTLADGDQAIFHCELQKVTK